MDQFLTIFSYIEWYSY